MSSTSTIYLKPISSNRPTFSSSISQFFSSLPKSFSLGFITPVIDLKLCLLCLLWYSTSVVSSNSTKAILREFKYPVTLTELQFVMNGLLCLITVTLIKNFNNLFTYHNNKYGKKKINPNSLYADMDNSHFTLVELFPKGTFPINIESRDYSILKNFLKPTRFVLTTTLPMGIFQFVGHIASHKSTSIIPVSLVHTIKALSPLTTVLIYRFFFNIKFSYMTYITLIPLIVGVMLCCTKNHDISIPDDLFYTGCFFAFVSMLIFVSQNIFAKKILTVENDNQTNEINGTSGKSSKMNNIYQLNDKTIDYFSRINSSLSLNLKVVRNESASTTPILPISHSPRNISPPLTPLSQPSDFYTKNNNNTNTQSSSNPIAKPEKLDKMSVLFYCSIVGFFLTLPVYLFNDFLSSDINSIALLNTKLMKLLFINGLSHFMQSIVAFTILGMVSPINYSIANILKRIIIISFSIFLEGTKLSFSQYLGLGSTFVGLYCYDKWGVQRKKT